MCGRASCGEAMDSGLGLGLVCRPMEGQVGTRLVGVCGWAYWGDTDRHVAGWLRVRGINEWHSKMGVGIGVCGKYWVEAGKHLEGYERTRWISLLWGKLGWQV